MTVQTFKLVTGEDVVAELVDTIREGGSARLLLESQGDGPVTGYKVRRPHVLRINAIQGRPVLALIPWTLANPGLETVVIPEKMVALVYDPSGQVEQEYSSQTTGLDLTTKPTGRISV